MPVLVPPAVFQEVQAIFNSPMLAHESQQVRRRDLLRIKTRDEVADVVRDPLAGAIANLTIHAENWAATRQVESLSDIVGVVQIKPHATGFFESSFLSVVMAARAKQLARASSVSPWLPSI